MKKILIVFLFFSLFLTGCSLNKDAELKKQAGEKAKAEQQANIDKCTADANEYADTWKKHHTDSGMTYEFKSHYTLNEKYHYCFIDIVEKNSANQTTSESLRRIQKFQYSFLDQVIGSGWGIDTFFCNYRMDVNYSDYTAKCDREIWKNFITRYMTN